MICPWQPILSKGRVHEKCSGAVDMFQVCPWSGPYQLWVLDIPRLMILGTTITFFLSFAVAQLSVIAPGCCGQYGLRGDAALRWLWRTLRLLLAACSVSSLLCAGAGAIAASFLSHESTPLERGEASESAQHAAAQTLRLKPLLLKTLGSKPPDCPHPSCTCSCHVLFHALLLHTLLLHALTSPLLEPSCGQSCVTCARLVLPACSLSSPPRPSAACRCIGHLVLASVSHGPVSEGVLPMASASDGRRAGTCTTRLAERTRSS